ncbi:hypothetical protein EPIR_2869 [Erwinia piriflorinigrans CFBP 5888]|uniref:Uncharacterized protein n=1 Tax=Erwinia piriflorinigrans CFBP 5888 TaxID=1161919 RepID=V5ZB20_9GAMM|nr:hypothetical protein EPIR_2869 [Erwinia piriflorinigrans CFBP 5888]
MVAASLRGFGRRYASFKPDRQQVVLSGLLPRNECCLYLLTTGTRREG